MTKNEVREICLQAAVYCGFPEGLGAFRIAKKYYTEAEASKKTAVKPKPKHRS